MHCLIINFIFFYEVFSIYYFILYSLLQKQLFSDVKIAVKTENQSTDIPELIHSHKPVLKVRVPAFYSFLIEHKESKLSGSYNSFLEESELKEFLK